MTAVRVTCAVTLLRPGQWRMLRDLRLAALADSPGSFLASHAIERLWTQERWQHEFAGARWYAARAARIPAGITGVTLCPETGRHFIGRMWVRPESRRQGVAGSLLRAALDGLKAQGIAEAWLWVLNGNEAAAGLYESSGFAFTGEVQPMKCRPGRSEHLMRAELA